MEATRRIIWARSLPYARDKKGGGQKSGAFTHKCPGFRRALTAAERGMAGVPRGLVPWRSPHWLSALSRAPAENLPHPSHISFMALRGPKSEFPPTLLSPSGRISNQVNARRKNRRGCPEFIRRVHRGTHRSSVSAGSTVSGGGSRATATGSSEAAAGCALGLQEAGRLLTGTRKSNCGKLVLAGPSSEL